MDVETSSPSERKAGGSRRRAIFVSIAFHVVAAVVLLCWYVPRYRSSSDNGNANLQAEALGESDGSDEPAGDIATPRPKESVEVPPEQIEASITSQIERVETLSEEQQLSELEKNLKRLNAISSPESVQQVTATIADSLGLEPGSVPAESPVEGEFDADTAQLHDVTKVFDDAGNEQYESVLVDSEGRTQRVPMSAADGETAYNAFQQMKRFPMAAGIYRQVVMPLVQRMIEASDAAERAARLAEEMEQTGQGPGGQLDRRVPPMNVPGNSDPVENAAQQGTGKSGSSTDSN